MQGLVGPRGGVRRARDLPEMRAHCIGSDCSGGRARRSGTVEVWMCDAHEPLVGVRLEKIVHRHFLVSVRERQALSSLFIVGGVGVH